MKKIKIKDKIIEYLEKYPVSCYSQILNEYPEITIEQIYKVSFHNNLDIIKNNIFISKYHIFEVFTDFNKFKTKIISLLMNPRAEIIFRCNTYSEFRSMIEKDRIICGHIGSRLQMKHKEFRQKIETNLKTGFILIYVE